MLLSWTLILLLLNVFVSTLLLFLTSCEAYIILLTMLVLDCSSVLISVSNKFSDWFIILSFDFSSSCKCSVWSLELVLASWFKGIKFIVKHFNIYLQALQDFLSQVNKFGFIVCSINVSIYLATIWLFKSIIVFFFWIYKTDCEVRDWNYWVGSSRFIQRWNRGLQVWNWWSYHVVQWVFEDLSCWKIGSRLLSIPSA